MPQPVAPRPPSDGGGGGINAMLARYGTGGSGGGEEDEGNAFGRGLGFIVNNPLTQAALKPLQIADYGRRGIISGLNEFAEMVIPGDGEGETASFGDW